MILFHGSNHRCLEHFYLEHVTKHLRHLFPRLVFYVMMKAFVRGKRARLLLSVIVLIHAAKVIKGFHIETTVYVILCEFESYCSLISHQKARSLF